MFTNTSKPARMQLAPDDVGRDSRNTAYFSQQGSDNLSVHVVRNPLVQVGFDRKRLVDELLVVVLLRGLAEQHANAACLFDGTESIPAFCCDDMFSLVFLPDN